MIFRIFCGLIIVTGFVYLGRIRANGEMERLYQLNSFCDGLNMLEFNIRFLSLPMEEALKRAGECCIEPVRNIFENSSEILRSEKCLIGEAFLKSLKNSSHSVFLSNHELEILKSFARSLGKGDRECEIVNIQAAITRLSASETDAVYEVEKKAKAIKGISTLAGLFTAIILF